MKKNITISARVPLEIANIVEQYAANEKKTVSSFIHTAILEHIWRVEEQQVEEPEPTQDENSGWIYN